MKSHLKGLTFIRCNLSSIFFCDTSCTLWEFAGHMLHWEMFLATCFILNDYIHDINETFQWLIPLNVAMQVAGMMLHHATFEKNCCSDVRLIF